MLRNKGGQPYSLLLAARVHGMLQGNGQDALIASEDAMRNALSVQFLDLVFRADDGTVTPLSLLNAGSITGVRITDGPHFEGTSGAEYVGVREFSFEAEAEYPLRAAPLFLDFTETLSFEGGGPTYGFRRNVNGIPQKQRVWPATEYFLTQSGRLTGYLNYPAVSAIPGARFPAALLKAGSVKKEGPQRKGPSGWEGFPVTWEYHMVASTPFPSGAVPTLWSF